MLRVMNIAKALNRVCAGDSGVTKSADEPSFVKAFWLSEGCRINWKSCELFPATLEIQSRLQTLLIWISRIPAGKGGREKRRARQHSAVSFAGLLQQG